MSTIIYALLLGVCSITLASCFSTSHNQQVLFLTASRHILHRHRLQAKHPSCRGSICTKVLAGSLDNDNMSGNDTINKIQLVLLDRDGVINQDVGSPGVVTPSQLQLTPNAGHAMGNLKRAGYKIAMITNQSCVGKGLITRQELDSIMNHLQQMLVEQDPDAIWDDIFCCTTHSGQDHRRKPEPGMILEACAQFQVEPECVVAMVGDTLTDLQAAQRAGVPQRILVSTGYGKGIMQQHYYANETGALEEDAVVVQPKVFTAKSSNGPNRHKDDLNQQETLESVMPFVYLQNFDQASKWILQRHQQQSQI